MFFVFLKHKHEFVKRLMSSLHIVFLLYFQHFMIFHLQFPCKIALLSLVTCIKIELKLFSYAFVITVHVYMA